MTPNAQSARTRSDHAARPASKDRNRARGRTVTAAVLASVVAASVVAAGTLGYSRPGSAYASAMGVHTAAASRPPLIWLGKVGDIARVAAFAGNHDALVPPFTWRACGGPGNLSCPAPLKGQVPVYASERALWALAGSNYSGYVVFDIEVWHATPGAERAHPLKYICRAARLSRQDPRMKVIITPFNPSPVMMTREAVQAAACNAYAVDIQAQFANGHPGKFQAFVRRTIIAVRAKNARIKILVGLSSNNAAPQSPRHLLADYRLAVAAGAQGIWWNAPDWGRKNACKGQQGGRGCPATLMSVWQHIGRIPDPLVA